MKHQPAEFPKKIKKPRHNPRIPISNIEGQINEVEDIVTSKSNETKRKIENEAPVDSNKNKKRKLQDTVVSEELTTEASTESFGVKVKKNKNKRKKGLKEKPEETDTSPQVNEEVLGSEVKSKKKKKDGKKSIKDESTEKEDGNIEDSKEEIEKEVGDEPKKKIVDPEADDKTIFVGNWPVNKVKKHLKKYFVRYGVIEAVRFRSVPLSDTRISKKVTAITKQFHPDRTSTNAYVRFTTKDSAIKAVQANGTSIDNHHLRVTLCNATEHDLSKSVFLGNIQFRKL